MSEDPRKTALKILVSWHRSPHTLDRSLDAHAQVIERLSKKDKNLCNALVFGVLRHRNLIDHVIAACSNIPMEKINPAVLYLMRIALFQIIKMDRVPGFAATDSAVRIAKKQFGKKTAGFVNAVLRNGAKNWSGVKYPDQQKDAAGSISVHYSIPLWLAKKWLTAYGPDNTVNICRQINTIPEITLRTNTLKTERSALMEQIKKHVKTIQLSPHADDGISFTGPDTPIHEMDTFKQGLFQIQDEAAQIVTQLLAPRPGERILDACAGLGGKTGHIAQMMKNKGSLTAVEIEADKLDVLELEAKRLGIDIIRARPLNLLKTSVKDFETYFDRVLLDAPCTGLGVLRRNPDTKWKRTRADIVRLAGKQKKMLNAAANLVRPGGTLVFAVCSCEEEENEKVIEAFLGKRKDFKLDTEGLSNIHSDLTTPSGFIKTYPRTNGMDGFFTARLKRKVKNQ